MIKALDMFWITNESDKKKYVYTILFMCTFMCNTIFIWFCSRWEVWSLDQDGDNHQQSIKNTTEGIVSLKLLLKIKWIFLISLNSDKNRLLNFV